MKAVVFDQPGDESMLRVGEVEAPALGPGALRIRVAAAGVNRADLLQRRGMYPPPPGASPLLGLECAGEVMEVGAGVSGWKPGDRAMALLAGGGYAEQVVVDAGSALPVPGALSFEEAAALPEVYLTVFLNVFELGALPERGRPPRRRNFKVRFTDRTRDRDPSRPGMSLTTFRRQACVVHATPSRPIPRSWPPGAVPPWPKASRPSRSLAASSPLRP